MRYGMYSSTAGTGSWSEEVGRQMCAESRTPSDIGIVTCSSSFVAYGRLVT